MNFRANIYLRVFRTVLKGISSVKKSHAVDVLNITLLEVQPEREFLCRVMQGIQCFCLSFWNGRNVCATLLFAIPSEVATRILNDNVAILIIKQGPLRVARVTAKTRKTRCNLGRLCDLIDRPIKRPLSSKNMDEVGPGCRELIIYSRSTTDSWCTALYCIVQGKQCDKIPDVRVEDLFVRGVGWITDTTLLTCMTDGQILDMCEHSTSGILLPSSRTHMWRNTWWLGGL